MDTKDKKEFNSPYAIYIWLALALLLLIASLVASGGKIFRLGNGAENQNGSITISIDYGSSQKKFRGQFSDKVRVWDLLQQATAVSGTSLVAVGNFVPQKIDGHQSNTKEGWQYYMNGVLQTTPPFETFASVGDEIIFKWEAYNDTHPKKW